MKKKLLALAVAIPFLTTNAMAAENLAPSASITASSEFSDAYLASNVADGRIWEHDQRLPEWATDYETEAVLTLKWSEEVTVTKAVLYDRANTDDNVVEGTLTFSDGTTVEFGELDPTGEATEVVFSAPITCTSVEVYILGDEETTLCVGLDEIMLYTADGVNVAPLAEATADSEHPDGDPYWFVPDIYTNWYSASNAISGIAMKEWNADGAVENEWASKGEQYPSITFTWPADVTIGTIALVDRIGNGDHTIGGDIVFGDGSVVSFTGLDDTGAVLYVDIPNVTTNTFTINVTETGSWANPGFAEIYVYAEHFDADGNEIAAETSETMTPETEEPEATAPETEEPEATVPETKEPETIEKAPAEAPQTADTAIVAIAITMVSLAAAIALKKVRA